MMISHDSTVGFVCPCSSALTIWFFRYSVFFNPIRRENSTGFKHWWSRWTRTEVHSHSGQILVLKWHKSSVSLWIDLMPLVPSAPLLIWPASLRLWLHWSRVSDSNADCMWSVTAASPLNQLFICLSATDRDKAHAALSRARLQPEKNRQNCTVNQKYDWALAEKKKKTSAFSFNLTSVKLIGFVIIIIIIGIQQVKSSSWLVGSRTKTWSNST